MFEIAKTSKVEKQQDCHDLTVRHSGRTPTMNFTLVTYCAFFAFSASNSLQNSSTAQKISVILSILSIWQFLLFGYNLLIFSYEVTKNNWNCLIFLHVSYPELR